MAKMWISFMADVFVDATNEDDAWEQISDALYHIVANGTSIYGRVLDVEEEEEEGEDE